MLQLAPLHTADDMRLFSDLAHHMEGAILGVSAAAALAEWWRHGRPTWVRLVWPAIFAVAGITLLTFLLLPHHGLDRARDQWSFVLGDPQQRQHVILAILAAIGGGVELGVRTGRLAPRIGHYAWPAMVILGGALFALHPQHGDESAVRYTMAFHRILGALLIVTGLIRIAELRAPSSRRALGAIWGVTLLAASAMLFTYREPPGAYETAGHAAHAGGAGAAGDSGGGRR